jgi:hypothetical protein
MSGERPDFQQPTGITSQAFGVATEAEATADSNAVGTNIDRRTLAAGGSAFFTLDPNQPNTAVVLERGYVSSDSSTPSQIRITLISQTTGITGNNIEVRFTEAQAPVTLRPGFFVAPGNTYLISVANDTNSSARIETQIALRVVQ